MDSPQIRVKRVIDLALDAVLVDKSVNTHVIVIACESTTPSRVCIQLGSTIGDEITQLMILRACVNDLAYDVERIVWPSPSKA